MAVTHDRDDHGPGLNLGGGPTPGPRETVADTLRRARKDYGQDLRTIAQVLRIRYVYLKAIEAGEFDRLPGIAYAVGFLRTYAEFLGLDGNQIVERFKEETEGAERKTELIFPEPVTEGKIPGGAIVLISALLLGLVYGGWSYFSNQDKSIADLIPPLPEQLQDLLDGDAQPAAADRAASSRAPMPSIAQPDAPPADAPRADAPPGAGAAAEVPAEPAAETAPPAREPAAVDDQAQAETGAVESVLPPGAAAPMVLPPAPVPTQPVRDGTQTTQAEAPTQIAVQAAPAVPGAPETGAPETGAPGTVTPGTVTPGTVTPGIATPEAATPEAAPAGETAGNQGPAANTDTAPAAPVVQQTVVIPAPPMVPQTVFIPSERSPRVYGETNEVARIVLRATQDSWVQVRDRDDALLLTRVLRSGDTYLVPNQEGLTLLTGNAGGIEIEVDGVKVPPLGPVGLVRRQIALDPARLLSGEAMTR